MLPWSWERSGEWPSWGCCERWQVACLRFLSPEPHQQEEKLFSPLLLPLRWLLDWYCRFLSPGTFFGCSRTPDVSSAWRRQIFQLYFCIIYCVVVIRFKGSDNSGQKKSENNNDKNKIIKKKSSVFWLFFAFLHFSVSKVACENLWYTLKSLYLHMRHTCSGWPGRCQPHELQ